MTRISVAKSSESLSYSAVNHHSVAPYRARSVPPFLPCLHAEVPRSLAIVPNHLLHRPWSCLQTLKLFRSLQVCCPVCARPLAAIPAERKYAPALSCHPLFVRILPTYPCLIKANLLADLENFGCEFTLCMSLVSLIVRPPRTGTYSGVGGDLTRARTFRNKRAPLHWWYL